MNFLKPFVTIQSRALESASERLEFVKQLLDRQQGGAGFAVLILPHDAATNPMSPISGFVSPVDPVQLARLFRAAQLLIMTEVERQMLEHAQNEALKAEAARAAEKAGGLS